MRVIAAVAFLALASCRSEGGAEATAPTVHEMMVGKIDPQADIIWEVGNRAIGEKAGLDPAKLDDKDWATMERGARALQSSALQMTEWKTPRAAAAGVKILDEGQPGVETAAEVQASLERDPETFRALALALVGHAGEIADAARGHDARQAGLLIDRLDGVCESCHVTFWYPKQKPVIDSMQRSDLHPAISGKARSVD